jgi:hypothetical protein
MNTAIAVRTVLIGAGCALVLAGCGSGEAETTRAPAAARPAATPAATAAPRHAARDLIVFRRVRFEGATLNVMTVRSDGSLKIDVPNGGAGGAKFVSRVTPRALRGVRRAMARTPWRHLSKRKVVFDRSGAYFILHHRGEDYIAMADGMSVDLKPLVTRLNAILTGGGQRSERRLVHRWGKA